MQRGASLLELLLVLALAGLLSALALPRCITALDGILTRQAADRTALAHAQGRRAALAGQRVARVTISADSLVVSVGDSLAWQLPGPARQGVQLTGGGTTDYAPNGLAMGAGNARYEVARGRARLAVLVSRLGRVRIVRSAG
jgi:prepilin-type N-terminal cleavage/methylation domain-containing protein